ncbi:MULTISPECIES: hypothetical protein [unclassified Lysobacter]|uniref:hypothetical protein n=1 Tax=unclassified Lysobacter TaxID=2635362 RepID=UPI001F5A2B92|nr:MULTISPECIES: hypothetical protein [unclassified Lysobacter]
MTDDVIGSGRPEPGSVALLVMLTLFNVGLQLGSALMLKLAPDLGSGRYAWIGILLGGVLVLNVVRFVIWGAVHRRYPLSVAYPASAVFFPGILAMAWWFGETVGPSQVAGAGLVMVGVVVLLSERSMAS